MMKCTYVWAQNKKKTQYKTVEGQHEFHFRFG